MVYEIYYVAEEGAWRIRITTIYLFIFYWSNTVSRRPPPTLDGKVRSPVPVEFSTYEEAAAYAVSIGIDKAYRLRRRSTEYASWVNAEGCHA